MPIEIKKATIDDYDNFLLISKEVGELHKKNVLWFFKDTPFPIEHYKSIINNPDVIFLLAQEGDIIVGYIIASRKELNAYNIKERKFMFIEDFGVLDSYRNKGIGTILLNEVEKICIDEKIKDLELNVWIFNTDAISFYSKKGFTSYSQKMRKRVF